ncbi:MAG: hypothetical protein C4541_06135 [Candidatus Auribacter fodinae]|uniref:Glycosyltransferase 2-like domain-containing protein n=1 Tax=Candidatus Auribacter fodinae TaxID=2093366 RepID=A0A3A4R9I4_9BACT|nr:MAG: hypothetical protein C4541_06135 [Candidatus Auribacter fodinae]
MSVYRIALIDAQLRNESPQTALDRMKAEAQSMLETLRKSIYELAELHQINLANPAFNIINEQIQDIETILWMYEEFNPEIGKMANENFLQMINLNMLKSEYLPLIKEAMNLEIGEGVEGQRAMLNAVIYFDVRDANLQENLDAVREVVKQIKALPAEILENFSEFGNIFAVGTDTYVPIFGKYNGLVDLVGNTQLQRDANLDLRDIFVHEYVGHRLLFQLLDQGVDVIEKVLPSSAVLDIIIASINTENGFNRDTIRFGAKKSLLSQRGYTSDQLYEFEQVLRQNGQSWSDISLSFLEQIAQDNKELFWALISGRLYFYNGEKTPGEGLIMPRGVDDYRGNILEIIAYAVQDQADIPEGQKLDKGFKYDKAAVQEIIAKTPYLKGWVWNIESKQWEKKFSYDSELGMWFNGETVDPIAKRYEIFKQNVQGARLAASSLNVQAHKEESIEFLEKGNNISVGYIKVQNFKNAFNTFGDAIGAGHFLGDAGIDALGKVLQRRMNAFAQQNGLESVSVGNLAVDFYMTFNGVSNQNIAQLFENMLLSEEFKMDLIAETKNSLQRMIGSQQYAVVKDALNQGLTLDRIQFYGGVSSVSSKHAQLDGKGAITNAPAVIDRLYKEAFLAAKHRQITFSDNYFDKNNRLSEKLITAKAMINAGKAKGSSAQINQMFTNLLNVSRFALQTGVYAYEGDIAEEIESILEYGLMAAEYEMVVPAIAPTYNPENTITALLAEYRQALYSNAPQSEINALEAKLFDKVVIYQSDFVSQNDGVFVGNPNFKATINLLLSTQPQSDVSLTFRIGGDEYGKLVWTADDKNLRIYRFDGNNVGATSREWGMRIGDKLIDESMRIISETRDIAKLQDNISEFFNDMGLENGIELSEEEMEQLSGHNAVLIMYEPAYTSPQPEDIQSYTSSQTVVVKTRDKNIMVKFPTINVAYPVQSKTKEINFNSPEAEEGVPVTIVTGDQAIDFIVYRNAQAQTVTFETASPRAPPQRIEFTEAELKEKTVEKVISIEGFKPINLDFYLDTRVPARPLLQIDGNILTVNERQFNDLKQQGNLRVDEGAYVVPVTSRPVVSTGYVDVSVRDLNPDDRMLLFQKDLSVIQGRADSSSDRAKEHVKMHQLLNQGDVDVRKTVVEAPAFRARDIQSFADRSQSMWDGAVAEYILEKQDQLRRDMIRSVIPQATTQELADIASVIVFARPDAPASALQAPLELIRDSKQNAGKNIPYKALAFAVFTLPESESTLKEQSQIQKELDMLVDSLAGMPVISDSDIRELVRLRAVAAQEFYPDYAGALKSFAANLPTFEESEQAAATIGSFVDRVMTGLPGENVTPVYLTRDGDVFYLYQRAKQPEMDGKLLPAGRVFLEDVVPDVRESASTLLDIVSKQLEKQYPERASMPSAYRHSGKEVLDLYTAIFDTLVKTGTPEAALASLEVQGIVPEPKLDQRGRPIPVIDVITTLQNSFKAAQNELLPIITSYTGMDQDSVSAVRLVDIGHTGLANLLFAGMLHSAFPEKDVYSYLFNTRLIKAGDDWAMQEDAPTFRTIENLGKLEEYSSTVNGKVLYQAGTILYQPKKAYEEKLDYHGASGLEAYLAHLLVVRQAKQPAPVVAPASQQVYTDIISDIAAGTRFTGNELAAALQSANAASPEIQRFVSLINQVFRGVPLDINVKSDIRTMASTPEHAPWVQLITLLNNILEDTPMPTIDADIAALRTAFANTGVDVDAVVHAMTRRALDTSYQAAVFDLDGTLLPSPDQAGGVYRIPELVKTSIQSMLNRGVPVIIITGRTQDTALESISEIIHPNLYVFVENGAYGFKSTDPYTVMNTMNKSEEIVRQQLSNAIAALKEQFSITADVSFKGSYSIIVQEDLDAFVKRVGQNPALAAYLENNGLKIKQHLTGKTELTVATKDLALGYVQRTLFDFPPQAIAKFGDAAGQYGNDAEILNQFGSFNLGDTKTTLALSAMDVLGTDVPGPHGLGWILKNLSFIGDPSLVQQDSSAFSFTPDQNNQIAGVVNFIKASNPVSAPELLNNFIKVFTQAADHTVRMAILENILSQSGMSYQGFEKAFAAVTGNPPQAFFPVNSSPFNIFMSQHRQERLGGHEQFLMKDTAKTVAGLLEKQTLNEQETGDLVNTLISALFNINAFLQNDMFEEILYQASANSAEPMTIRSFIDMFQAKTGTSFMNTLQEVAQMFQNMPLLGLAVMHNDLQPSELESIHQTIRSAVKTVYAEDTVFSNTEFADANAALAGIVKQYPQYQTEILTYLVGTISSEYGNTLGEFLSRLSDLSPAVTLQDMFGAEVIASFQQGTAAAKTADVNLDGESDLFLGEFDQMFDDDFLRDDSDGIAPGGKKEDKNIAFKSVMNKVDDVIANSINQGNAVRISLADLRVKSPEEIVAAIFGDESDIPAVTANLVALFDKLPASAVENLARQLNDPFVRAQLKTGLTEALSVLQSSQYVEELKGYTLSVMIDREDIFYGGEALAHAGASRKTIYLNLAALAHLASMDVDAKSYNKRILQAVLEHEYRDAERGTHQDDIGVTDTVMYEGKNITFNEVRTFWDSIRNRPSEFPETTMIDGTPVNVWRVTGENMPVLLITSDVLAQLGVASAGQFLALLSKAAALEKTSVNKIFANVKDTVVVSDLSVFNSTFGININQVAPKFDESTLEPYEVKLDVPYTDQIAQFTMPKDFFIISPMFNLISRLPVSKKESSLSEQEREQRTLDEIKEVRTILKAAHDKGYINRLVIVDDASTDGLQWLLKIMNNKFDFEKDIKPGLQADITFTRNRIEDRTTSETEREKLRALDRRLTYFMDNAATLESYDFNAVLRTENGHRTGAIRDAVLGIYKTFGNTISQKMFIIDGDSFVEGADVLGYLRDAAEDIGSVDQSGKRVIGTILPLTTQYETPKIGKNSLMEIVNYSYMTWRRSMNARMALSIPGGGGGYSLPHLVRVLEGHSGIFETDDAELSEDLRNMPNTRFKFFGRKSFRVITDLPTTLKQRFQQSRRWSGGLSMVLRKYVINKQEGKVLPRKIFRGAVASTVLMTVVGGAILAGLIPMVQMVLGDMNLLSFPAVTELKDLNILTYLSTYLSNIRFGGIMPFVHLGSLFAGVFFLIFNLPTLLFNKDATFKEKIMLTAMFPFMTLNFIVFDMGVGFLEAFITALAAVKKGVGIVAQPVVEPVIGLARQMAVVPQRLADGFYAGSRMALNSVKATALTTFMLFLLANFQPAVAAEKYGTKRAKDDVKQEMLAPPAPGSASGDKNIASKEVQDQVDGVIRNHINDGKAVRISLANIRDKLPEQFVNELFEGEENAAQLADRLSGLFADLPAQARQNLEQKLSDRFTREQIKKGLVSVVAALQSSSYLDRMKDFSLTVLLDKDDIFAEGEALAHAGSTRNTIYINLDTIVYLADMEPQTRAFNQRVLQAVLEHEYRDAVNGGHQNDIGIVDPVRFNQQEIAFTDVQVFWNLIRNRQRGEIIERDVDGQTVQILRFEAPGIGTIEISTDVMNALGIVSPDALISSLNKAAVLAGKRLNRVFRGQDIITLDSVAALDNLKEQFGIDLWAVSPQIPVDTLEPVAVMRDVPNGDQLRQFKMPNDFIIVSPMFNLRSREETGLVEEVIRKAAEKGYLNRLVIVDDASKDGTQTLLKILNSRYDIDALKLEIQQEIEQTRRLIASGAIDAQKKAELELLEKQLAEDWAMANNPDLKRYDFNVQLRDVNGRRTGAIRDAVLGLHSIFGDTMPQKLFIMDGDSFIEGEDVLGSLRDAASMINSVDKNGKRIIGTILPLTTQYQAPKLGKNSLMEIVNYTQMTWLRSFSAHSEVSIPGGGGGYSLPYLVRALQTHSGIFETDDMELSRKLGQNKNTRFHFFARKDFRVITDLPTTLKSRWQQSRRWAGGLFMVMRKYAINKEGGKQLAPHVLRDGIISLIGYGIIGSFILSGVILPAIMGIMAADVGLMLFMGGFGLVVSYLLFTIPIYLLNKDASREERSFSWKIAPLMGLNFMIFTMGAGFSEAFITIGAAVLAGLKIAASPFTKAAATLASNFSNSNAQIVKYLEGIRAKAGDAGLVSGFFGGMTGLVATQIAAENMALPVSGSGMFTRGLLAVTGFLVGSVMSVLPFVGSLEALLPYSASTRAANRREQIQEEDSHYNINDTSLKRKEVKDAEVNNVIRKSIEEGRAIRLSIKGMKAFRTIAHRLNGDQKDVLAKQLIQAFDTPVFGLTDLESARANLRAVIESPDKVKSLQDGMAVLDAVLSGLNPSFSKELMDNVTFTILNDQDQGFGTGRILAHAGRRMQTVYIDSGLFDYVASLPAESRPYAIAVLRSILEHELRDMIRGFHEDDIGIRNNVPDPVRDGEIIDFPKVEKFWKGLEHFKRVQHFLETEVDDVSAETIGDVLLDLSQFYRSLSQQERNLVFGQGIQQMADTLFTRLLNYFDSRNRAIARDILENGLTPAKQKEFEFMRKNLALRVIHPDKVSEFLSNETQENQRLVLGKINSMEGALKTLEKSRKIDDFIVTLYNNYPEILTDLQLAQIEDVSTQIQKRWEELNNAINEMNASAEEVQKLLDTFQGFLLQIGTQKLHNAAPVTQQALANGIESIAAIQNRLAELRTNGLGSDITPIINEIQGVARTLRQAWKQRVDQIRAPLAKYEAQRQELQAQIAKYEEANRMINTDILSTIDSYLRTALSKPSGVNERLDIIKNMFEKRQRQSAILQNLFVELVINQRSIDDIIADMNAGKISLTRILPNNFAQVVRYVRESYFEWPSNQGNFEMMVGDILEIIANNSEELGLLDEDVQDFNYLFHASWELNINDNRIPHPVLLLTETYMSNFFLTNDRVMILLAQDFPDLKSQIDIYNGWKRKIAENNARIKEIRTQLTMDVDYNVDVVNQRVERIERLSRKMNMVLNKLSDNAYTLGKKYYSARISVLNDVRAAQDDITAMPKQSRIPLYTRLKDRLREMALTINALAVQRGKVQETPGTGTEIVKLSNAEVLKEVKALVPRGVAVSTRRDAEEEQERAELEKARKQHELVISEIDARLASIEKKLRVYNGFLSRIQGHGFRLANIDQLIGFADQADISRLRDDYNLFETAKSDLLRNTFPDLVLLNMLENQDFLDMLDEKGISVLRMTAEQQREYKDLNNNAETEEDLARYMKLMELDLLLQQVQKLPVRGQTIDAVVMPKNKEKEFNAILNNFVEFLNNNNIDVGAAIRPDALGLYEYLISDRMFDGEMVNTLFYILKKSEGVTDAKQRIILARTLVMFSQIVVSFSDALAAYHQSALQEEKASLQRIKQENQSAAAQIQAQLDKKSSLLSRVGTGLRRVFTKKQETPTTGRPELTDSNIRRLPPRITYDEFDEDLRLAAQRKPLDELQDDVDKPDDKSLARRQVQSAVNDAIRENIEAGRAIRINLDTMRTGEPATIVSTLMSDLKAGRIDDAAKRFQTLFGELPASANTTLQDILGNPAVQQNLENGLNILFEVLQLSGYQDLTDFNVTILLDDSGIFYRGDALAHVGTAQRELKNIYLNLGTLAHIASLTGEEQAAAKRILQAVLEHEYRDLQRGNHSDDIGVENPVVHNDRAIDMNDVAVFWEKLQLISASNALAKLREKTEPFSPADIKTVTEWLDTLARISYVTPSSFLAARKEISSWIGHDNSYISMAANQKMGLLYAFYDYLFEEDIKAAQQRANWDISFSSPYYAVESNPEGGIVAGVIGSVLRDTNVVREMVFIQTGNHSVTSDMIQNIKIEQIGDRNGDFLHAISVSVAGIAEPVRFILRQANLEERGIARAVNQDAVRRALNGEQLDVFSRVGEEGVPVVGRILFSDTFAFFAERDETARPAVVEAAPVAQETGTAEPAVGTPQTVSTELPSVEDIEEARPATAPFTFDDLKSYILLYSNLPVHYLFEQLNLSGSTFDEFARDIFFAIMDEHKIIDDRNVPTAIILQIQDSINEYVSKEIDRLAQERAGSESQLSTDQLTRSIIDTAIQNAGAVDKLAPRGLKAKVLDIGMENIVKVINQLKTSNPQASERLSEVYALVKSAKIAVVPSVDGSYGISTTREGYQFTYFDRIDGQPVIFIGEGFYNSLLAGGIEEVLVHVGARELMRGMPEEKKLNESQIYREAADMRTIFGNTLPAMIEDLTMKGLENQRFKPLIDRIMELGNIQTSQPLSPATLNEVVSKMKSDLELEVAISDARLPDWAEFQVSPDLLKKAVSIITVAQAKPDIYLFPQELILADLSPANLMLRKTFQKFRLENERNEGRSAIFIAISLDNQRMSDFKAALDGKTVLREGSSSTQLFDFIVSVKNMDELVDLIRVEYPQLTRADLLNRVKMIDVPNGSLAPYALENGFRYQVVDDQQAVEVVEDKAVFMIDVLRAFGTKQVPDTLTVVDIRTDVIFDDENMEQQFGDVLNAFRAFMTEVDKLAGDSWQYSQLLNLFYTRVYPSLDAPTAEKFLLFDTVKNNLASKLENYVHVSELSVMFVQLISRDAVGRDFAYLQDKLKEQLDLHLIRNVYDKLKALNNTAPTIADLMKRVDSLGNIAIVENYAKYLQVQAGARSVNRNVMDLINKSFRLANEAA